MSYTFTLDSFNITNTRSAHADTAYAAFTIQVAGAGPFTKVRSIGGVNNGTHSVNLSFNGISINQGENIVMNYIIVNAGRDSRVDVETAMERVGRAFAIGGSGVPKPPQLASGMTSQPVLDWFGLQLQGIYAQGSCDGLVAVEQDTFTYVDLLPGTSGAPFTHTTSHNGTEPAGGCNKHVSGYSVTWRCVQEATVPDVSGHVLADKGSIKGALTLISGAGLVPKHVSGSNVAPVMSTMPTAGTVVEVHSMVSITTGNK